MIKEKISEYPCQIFRQRPKSPVQAVFVCTSSDIDDWSAVPIKKSGELRNFQRPEIETHVDEIFEFFSNHEENCSPSSIVIGFKKPVVCFDESGKEIDLKSVTPGKVIYGKIRIPFITSPNLGTRKEKEAVLQALIRRSIDSSGLNDEAKDIQSSIPDQDDQDDQDTEPEGDEALLSESDDDKDLTNGDSADLVPEGDLHSSSVKFIQGLKSLDIESLNDDEIIEWIRNLHDMEKPGLIIDGQHRTKGTKNKKIYFNVTAMPDAPWPELAFQFIVLNKSASKVEDSLLINIVGNSMSKEELITIEKRLNDSKIPVGLYQGVMKLHDDPESPFFGKLKFGVQGEKGIIDASSAKRKIVTFWYKCKIYPLVEHLLQGKTQKDKKYYWLSSGLWFEYLKAFWGEAKKFYIKNSTLWGDDLDGNGLPASRLMRVTLINLTQEAILEVYLDAKIKEVNNDFEGKKSIATLVPDVESFRKASEFYFNRLLPEFFEGWSPAASGFDGSPAVRDEYKKAVKMIVSGEKTITELKNSKNPHFLYRT